MTKVTMDVMFLTVIAVVLFITISYVLDRKKERVTQKNYNQKLFVKKVEQYGNNIK